jgi:hypothetical protein
MATLTARKIESKQLLDEIFLQPWFLPLESAIQVRNCIPPEYRNKMRYYFDDYGCLKCEKKTVPYSANGLCRRCLGHTQLRMVNAVKRRWTANLRPTEKRPPGINRMSEAQRLLRDIADWKIPKK